MPHRFERVQRVADDDGWGLLDQLAQAETVAPAMSNQGCYTGFLALALACGFLLPDAAMGRAFTIYGLACVAIAGVWGAATVQMRILFVQTVPAVLALVALYLA